MMRPVALALAACALAACDHAPAPADLDTKHDVCSSCRMTVADRTLAAQIVAPGEEPRFFDDLACLSQFLITHPLTDDAVVFVADHRTGSWTAATGAVFSRLPQRVTPMASGLLAHDTAESRQADPRAAGSAIVSAGVALGPRFAERTHTP